jgi:hypothetical protein
MLIEAVIVGLRRKPVQVTIGKKMVDEKIVEGVFDGYPCWSRL